MDDFMMPFTWKWKPKVGDKVLVEATVQVAIGDYCYLRYLDSDGEPRGMPVSVDSVRPLASEEVRDG